MFLHFKKQTNSNTKCGVMFTAGNCSFGLTLPISFHVLTIPSLQPLLLLKNQGEIIFQGQRVLHSCYLHLLITSKCVSHQHISLDLVKFLTLLDCFALCAQLAEVVVIHRPGVWPSEGKRVKNGTNDLLTLTPYSGKERTPAKKASNIRAS